MNREERRQKKQKEKQSAMVVVIVFVLIVAVLITGMAVAIRKLIASRPPKEQTEVVSTETGNLEPGNTGNVTEQTDPLLEQAKQMAANMTVEQKVAQLFVITPDALTGVSGATAAGDATKNSYMQYPVGGLIYMSANLKSTDQTTQMLSNMKNDSQEITGLPIFLGVNEEGGAIAPVASNAAFGADNVGNMSDIGATGDLQQAYNVGSTISSYLSTLGFNIDFAPVADVLTNTENTAIGSRSFGSDSQTVADMVCAELQGLNEHMVTGVVKYFPGQGSVTGNTSDGSVSTDRSLEELMSCELVPFSQAIQNGAYMIMVGHIAVPSVTGDNTPSSLSSVMIQDVLRGQLGFQGVVITDALNKKAISSAYGSADAAVNAVNAGADMLLMPDNFQEAYQGVLDAVINGTISEDRLNESVARIIKVKLTM